MGKKKTRKYDKEFKLNAVNLCLSSNRGYIAIVKDLEKPPIFSKTNSNHIFFNKNNNYYTNSSDNTKISANRHRSFSF